jgi:chaperonin cofactor prefoldin
VCLFAIGLKKAKAEGTQCHAKTAQKAIPRKEKKFEDLKKKLRKILYHTRS